ncbi:hypothetical protein GCM10010103_12830 [Streptomyces paradoxus]|uniref:Uncharacterized protein n=1 Tax=Streptomyces paradoxus TaxID=66375 RepID=A0A7W9T8J1_9ACTN|nr:hypothetical protein [Streptomyces paradoxus]MBB6075391.1 hypothetical protein [Streptomyces paradoxus]
MNAQRGSTEEQSLADLARRLLAADTGGWTPDGVNALADGLGWARGGTADRPVLITGRSGRTSGGAPLLFDVACGDRLSIGCFAPDGVDAASLVWGTVAEHPATASVWRDDDPVWRVDAGAPANPRAAPSRRCSWRRPGRPG